MFKNLSIQTKVLAILLVVFITVVSGTSIHTFYSERHLVDGVVIEKINDTAYAYFDGVNTMMLTGTMSQRETLRDKLMANDDILEVRMLRAESINKVYGPGLDHEKPIDELDRRALAGEEIMETSIQNGDEVITILKPIIASKDYRGTNCLTCHVVPEGTVLGGIRVSYSLERLHQHINKNLMTSMALNALMFGLGIASLVFMLHRVVFKRLANLRRTMHLIEETSDLQQRIQVVHDDEIGNVSKALNSMLERFSNGLGQVADMTHELTQASARISSVAEETSHGAAEQRSQTDSMATAIHQMEATAQEVRNSASSTAQASETANAAATEGAELTDKAIQGIQQLVTELKAAEEVISRLDDHSRSVGSVLDVIKGIAEQTNLLALNAAIEAARAGEQGRGFAVVADEVRTLATRSHESTQEIEQIIAHLQTDADNAVSTMSSARESAELRSEQISSAASTLSEIVAQVAHINDLNAQMAHAADEQGTVTENVNRSVTSISGIADRTAEGAGLTTQASAELEQLVKRLEDLLRTYRL